MKKEITERSWHSLSQLKEYIEAEGKETITCFDGYVLMTDTRIYTLALNKLNVVMR